MNRRQLKRLAILAPLVLIVPFGVLAALVADISQGLTWAFGGVSDIMLDATVALQAASRRAPEKP